MAESEWAKGMVQEFKAGKERKAEEDAKLQEEQTTGKGFAFELWTDARNFHRLAICIGCGRLLQGLGAEVQSKAMLGRVRGRNRQRLAAS
jgi:hypothetical protein